MGVNKPNESELYVKLFNGARIRVLGADNQEAIRGAYLDNVVLDEYPDMSPSLWGSIVRPMLADRQGTATFIGTPKGRNSFWDILNHAKANQGWYWSVLKASETGVLRKDELEAARKDMTPEAYAAEFEVSFDAPVIGSYYGSELASLEDRGHMLQSIAVDPSMPVNTAWDLGIGDSTAIWFWHAVGKELRIIDFYENHGKPLPHYVAELKSRGYNYGVDFVPHDAKVRELSTGRTRIETLISLGRSPQLVPDHKIADGINAVRITLRDCWFDSVKCRDGIEALYQYKRTFDDKRRVFSETPLHNFASHPADSFRGLAMAWKEMISHEVTLPRHLFIPTGELTIGDYIATGNSRNKKMERA